MRQDCLRDSTPLRMRSAAGRGGGLGRGCTPLPPMRFYVVSRLGQIGKFSEEQVGNFTNMQYWPSVCLPAVRELGCSRSLSLPF